MKSNLRVTLTYDIKRTYTVIIIFLIQEEFFIISYLAFFYLK